MKKEQYKTIGAILIIFLIVVAVVIIRNTEFGKYLTGEAYRYTIQPIKKTLIEQEKLIRPTTTITRAKKYLCTDTDNGIDFLTKGTVNSLKYLSGKEDYCYTFPNGKTYLMEGICKNNEYAYVQKNCGELGGNYVCEDGICIQKTCQNQNGNICEDYQVCSGTILSATDTNKCCLGECNLPESFDWRNRHGKNWLTSVKNQGSQGTCYSFAEIGTVEAHINLYYNQHINVDLAEQMLEDCGSCCSPLDTISISEMFLGEECLLSECGSNAVNFCRFKENGIILEDCDPYEGHLGRGECSYEYICTDWQDKKWIINDFEVYRYINPGETEEECEYLEAILDEDNLKKLLIEKGPLSSGVAGGKVYIQPNGDSVYISSGHAMVLIGYYVDDSGESNWIFKNSWGENSGEDGYIKINIDEDILPSHLPLGPFIPPTDESYSIICVDKDNDGFCNWGISEDQPSTCPASCKPEKDWDDSNSEIGALGMY